MKYASGEERRQEQGKWCSGGKGFEYTNPQFKLKFKSLLLLRDGTTKDDLPELQSPFSLTAHKTRQ
jgi:hypothetical protein